jgi:fructose-bisphosphate aldolase class I
VIHSADSAGIAAVMDQQFRLADQIGAAHLLPILEPEISIAASDRAAAEDMLVRAIVRRLDALTGDRQVVLKLTIPERPDTYAQLASHNRVARVLALSGGFARSEACHRLAYNHGMIASFSRALLEGLNHQMDDCAFGLALGEAIDQVYAASTIKSAST